MPPRTSRQQRPDRRGRIEARGGASTGVAEPRHRAAPTREQVGEEPSQRIAPAALAAGGVERWQYLLLAAFTVAAAALRFRHLGAWSFWIDEIYTLARADAHVNLPTILSQWWHPPVSVILTGLTIDVLGADEWSARLVPAALGTLTIPVLYFPVRRLFGVHAALITALLLSVSTWHLEWSQNARFYASLLLLYMLASFALFRAVETGRLRYIPAFYGLLLLALGERSIAVCLVPVAVSYLVLLRILPLHRPAGLRARYVALLLAPAASALAIDGLRFLLSGRSLFLEWADLTYGSPVDDPVRLAASIATSIGVPLVVFSSFSGLGLALQRSRAGLFVLLGAVVPILVLLSLNPVTFTRDRYVFMALPNWLILAGAGVAQLVRQARGRDRLIAAAVVFMLAADAMATNVAYFRVNNGHRLDWRGAFAQVAAARRDDDRIVTFWPVLGRHYLGAGAEVTAWEDVTPHGVATGSRRHWFVLDSETIFGNRPMKRWVEEHATLVEVRYLRRPMRAHLQVYLYDPAAP